MNHLIPRTFLYFGLLFLHQVMLSQEALSQPMTNEFEKMQGSRIRFTVEDPLDSLSSKEITELRDENGLPLWFSRNFHKVVCLTGECRMVHMRIYWDGAGNYLGFVPDEKEPLTKTDHHDFTPEDYRKLHTILADSISVLKTLKQEELIVMPEKKDQNLKVDAITGATRQYLQDYLVRNAAYTCYTLWHTVYGPTRNQLLVRLDARLNPEFLGKIFGLNNPSLQCWAIRKVGANPEYEAAFTQNILSLVQSGNDDLARTALNYFTTNRLSDPDIQQQMAASVGLALSQIRFEIVWKLKSLPLISDASLVILLDLYLGHKIYAGLLGYICEMIQPRQLKNPEINHRLKKLSKDKNQYVKNLADKLLKSDQ